MRIYYRYVLGFFVCSAMVISFISGWTTPAEVAPDEASHYSLTCFMVNHPTSFPISYHKVINFGKPWNHTIHPPFYYYSLATVARLLNSQSDLSKMCALRRDAIHQMYNLKFNRKLRNYSFVFTLFGYLGIFRLLDYLCKKNILSPLHTLLAAVLILFVPIHLYIVGMINNDVSVFFLWPYLTFYSTRFFLEGDLHDFLTAITFFMLSLISKATFWFFGPGFMILGLIKLYEIKKDNKLKENFSAHLMRNWVGIFLVLISFSFSAIQLGYNIREYGTPQPKYWQVYPGMTVQDSIFYRIPPEGMRHLSLKRMLKKNSRRILNNTIGLSHHGKKIKHIYKTFGVMLFVAAILAMLLGTSLTKPFKLNQKTILNFFYFIIPIIYFGIFMVYCHWDYYKQGFAGKSGRYFIGYMQLFFISLMILASIKPKAQHPVFVYLGQTLQWGSTLILLFIFCHPFFYLLADKHRGF